MIGLRVEKRTVFSKNLTIFSNSSILAFFLSRDVCAASLFFSFLQLKNR